MDLSSLSEKIRENIETGRMKFGIYKDKKYLMLPIRGGAEVFTEIDNVDAIVEHYKIQNYFKD